MAGELILIVEDNEKNRKLVRDMLQFHGYRTAEADTAEDGIALAQATPPALILMDIQLPRMNGIEALQASARRRADPRHPGDRGDRVGHDPGPAEDHGRRLRRLPGQAHRRDPVRGRGARDARSPPRRVRAAVSEPARILVVDDTPMNVKLLADVLAATATR